MRALPALMLSCHASRRSFQGRRMAGFPTKLGAAALGASEPPGWIHRTLLHRLVTAASFRRRTRTTANSGVGTVIDKNGHTVKKDKEDENSRKLSLLQAVLTQNDADILPRKLLVVILHVFADLPILFYSLYWSERERERESIFIANNQCKLRCV